MDKRVVIVLPAYNEAEKIGQVLLDIQEQVELKGMDVLVVDDGSKDSTMDIARSHGAQVITHKKNKGLGRTFKTSCEHSLRHGYDIMVFFDADGQFSAKDIIKLIRPLELERCDFVLGSRFIDSTPEGISKAKLFGNKFLAWFISRVTKVKVSDVACGFRAYSREALYWINVNSRFTYTQEVILDLLFKDLVMKEVPVKVSYFKGRKSVISSNLWKYGWRVGKIIVRAIRDYKPMHFFGVIGGLIFLVGLLLDVWMIWYFFTTGGFSPYKIVGFGGAFLNFLGISIWFIGLVADMLNRIKRNQEELMYFEKKNSYER